MSTITTKDGTEIYYKDWGEGPVVTFSHGWPLSSDAWDGQMLFLAQNGFRAVAHDRRGHGRSSQASSGNDMDGANAVLVSADRGQSRGHAAGGARLSGGYGRPGCPWNRTFMGSGAARRAGQTQLDAALAAAASPMTRP
jgi:non-heme chloroperoxidase